MIELSILATGVVLLVASLVAIVSRRLGLPYSVGLVIAGILLAFLPFRLSLPSTHDLIFDVFLPPLVFEASLQLEWRPFARELPITAMLAFPGVAIASVVVSGGVHFLLHWSWISSSLFGVLISATDPVSVIALFKEVAVERRLGMIVESESLLNDGAAAVGFVLLSSLAQGMSANVLSIAGDLAWTTVGGVAAGLAVAGALLAIAGRTQDRLVEITLTTIAAYGSFLLAERLGMSGVMAALAAGILVRNVGWMSAISEDARDHVLAFWEYAAFLANSFVFILIGEQEVSQPLSSEMAAASVAVLIVLLGRAAAVYPIAAIFSKSRLRLTWAYQHVLIWGGLRGALALALALSLPMQVSDRPEIISLAFAVVAFSIFVQGLSMPLLIRRFNLGQASIH